MMNKVYLSLGSNLGDSKENLDHATELLKENIHILRQSSYYETEPVGFKDQNWFLNIAVEGETDLSPEQLLDFTQSIEKEMKRIKTIRFGPRNIDIDILLYGDSSIETENLTIPHPRMLERAFVLVPLNEINPELTVGSISIKEALETLKGEDIRLLNLEGELRHEKN